VNGWDVVNEALNEDGTMRPSPWFNIIGADFIERAFEYAHEADPAAQLYYNDYNTENEAKRKGLVALLQRLKAAKSPIYGVGIQGHYHMDWPSSAQIAATIDAIAGFGLKAMITELDVDILPSAQAQHSADINATAEAKAQQMERLNPYTKGLPPEMQQKLADRYTEFFTVFVKHSKTVERVTFWGVTDQTSWLNGFPVRGRTNYPLLFDRDGKPKPAFNAVIQAAKAK
jgi:endo-1,4-beta-xylanase